MNLKKLIDMTIESINYDSDSIIFNTPDKSYKYIAVGDCCSQSYIEDLDNPEIFNGAIMLEIEIEHGPEETCDDDYHVNKWTFYKFKTTKGNCTLSFRNNSNGYYNGELEFYG